MLVFVVQNHHQQINDDFGLGTRIQQTLYSSQPLCPKSSQTENTLRKPNPNPQGDNHVISSWRALQFTKKNAEEGF